MRESKIIMENGKTLAIKLYEESGFFAEVIEQNGDTVLRVDGTETLMQLFYRLIDKGYLASWNVSNKELVYLYSKAIDDLDLA